MSTSASASATPSSDRHHFLEFEGELWNRVRSLKDHGARDQLLAHYLPYARTVAAWYYARRFHNEIEFDDYLQFASLGMIEALDRFDPEVGVQFKTFASRRMHGAILNGLETMTEKQQQIAVHKRMRQERQDSIKGDIKKHRLAHNAGRADRIAHAEALFSHLAEVGIGIALAVLLEGTAMFDANDGGSDFKGPETYYRRTELRQLRRRLLDHIDTLKPQARHVIRCHYLQELPFDEIAQSLGVTKGRVSQIHREALLALRTCLGEKSGCDVLW